MAVCQVNSNGIAKLYHYYNKEKDTPSYLSDKDPIIGFSNVYVSFKDGVLKCSFTRMKKLASVSNYFDLSNLYFILTASGKLDAASLIKMN